MNGLLLDTQIFLWHALFDPRLPEQIERRIAEGSEPLFLSIASAWEIAIKLGLGKLHLGKPIGELLGSSLAEHGIALLPLTEADVTAYASLAFPASGHRDPFDRILVVQCVGRDLLLVSADAAFEGYAVNLLRAS